LPAEPTGPADGLTRDIVVVGASAGGVRALEALVASLPRSFAASLFVVLHMSPFHKSMLPAVLGRRTLLPVVEPESGQVIERGYIYTAPSDRHLLIENNQISLWHGPKEDRHRPAINALFRSAAVSFGQRVIGVVLTGLMDDGTAGSWWIKKYGGVIVVQSPCDAIHADMPKNVLKHVAVDCLVTVAEMGPVIEKLSTGAKPASLCEELEQNIVE